MIAEARIDELGLQLPKAVPVAGNYVPAVRSGSLVFLAGTLCIAEGRMTHTGKVGTEQTVETGYQAARICALNSLANLRAAIGNLDRVQRIVSVTGFVNAVPGFSDSPAVINGASDLFVQVFGDAGRHARTAVAVCGLPRNATVELQVVVAVSVEDLSRATHPGFA